MQILLSLSDDREHQRALDETGLWGRQGAGLIIMCSKTGRLLLPLRSSMVEQPHTWGTWGGAIDDGEDPKAAAVREMREESGVKIDPRSVTKLFVFQKGTFKYTTFLALVDAEFKPRLDQETERAEWFAADNLPSPLHFGLRAVLDDSKARAVIDEAEQSVIGNQLEALVKEVEAYQDNHFGWYDKQKLVDAFMKLPEDVRMKFYRAPRGLWRGSDYYNSDHNFDEYCSGKTVPALSFTNNEGVANIFGAPKQYHDICVSFDESMDTSKLAKELNRRRIEHSIGDDEGEVILMGVRYRQTMK